MRRPLRENRCVRLEPLCTFEWRYDAEGRVGGGYVLLRPFGGEDGAGYGEGSGTVTGDRLAGTCVWSNHPRRRGDGRMLPNAHGLIVTDDGADVLFSLTGITVFDDEGRGRQDLTGTFTAQDDRYAWVNDLVCVAEGVIVPAQNTIDIRVYAAVNELV
jgi:hypothetical protein